MIRTTLFFSCLTSRFSILVLKHFLNNVLCFQKLSISYRDGRRNKGSVLRLSVSYIMELREAVSRMESLKQENTIARQLIPLLLQRIEVRFCLFFLPNRIVHHLFSLVSFKGFVFL